MSEIETKEQRIAKVKEFAKRVLDEYKDLIKCIVMMGSVVRDEFKPKSDIDVFLVVDDFILDERIKKELEEQSIKKFGKVDEKFIEAELPRVREERLEEIDEKVEKIAKEISDKISVQPSYTLTEFWDYARVAHPIIYNFIKEGEAIYDVGFFTPLKRLLKAGKIPMTREAIESYMESAPKKLMRAKTVKLLMLAEDCYYAMLNSAQAVLMFLGLPPPVPSKAYEEVKRYLVEPGILEPQYAEWLREIIEIRKKIEHKELMDVTGAFVDEWINKAEKFVNKMFALLGALEMRKKEKVLERTHEVMYKACLLYTSPSPRDLSTSRMPSSA